MPKLTKLTAKNQLTLPQAVVREFPGVEYFEIRVGHEGIVLRPVSVASSEDRLTKVRDRMKELGLDEKSVTDAVRWARRRHR